MPVRNIYKDYLPESYHHIYNRGLNGGRLFFDDKDYIVFLGLLKRYLGKEIEKQANRVPYPNFYDRADLLAFCLMPNHYHLFLYQKDSEVLKELLKCLGVAYGMYFNKRYKRKGAVFKQRYKAVHITNDSYFLHISRYIHMNPKAYATHRWSSLPYYLEKRQADWVKPSKILSLFENNNYMEFLDEYREKRAELEEIKSELANS